MTKFFRTTIPKEGKISFFKNLLSIPPSPLKIVQTADPSFPHKRLSTFKEDVSDSLRQFEQLESMAYRRMKVGVLFCAPSQTDEYEMFGNKDGSELFEEFLEFIGDRVELAGFEGYRGNLDVSEKELDGKHSVYMTLHEGQMECMFHVSTYLQYSPKDPKQLERKRYIGNDNVVIVFQEPGSQPYRCDTIMSEPNHALFVVTPLTEEEMNTAAFQQWYMRLVLQDARAAASDIPEADSSAEEVETYPDGSIPFQESPDLPLSGRFYRASVAYKSSITIPHNPPLEDPPYFAFASPSSRQRFREKIYALEQSTWTALENSQRLIGMRKDELQRIIRRWGK